MILLSSVLPDQLHANELSVADVFTDNSVLQQSMSVPVWGVAPPGQHVTVRFAGQSKSTKALKDGAWKVHLSPLNAESKGTTLLVQSGDQKIEFNNVVVGEVWYASGQSNMQMKLDACVRKSPAIRQLVEDQGRLDVRILRIEEADSAEPSHLLTKKPMWQVDSSGARKQQSAVAWFFARELQQKLNVPIGIIEGSWGGKPIEGFIPRDQFPKYELLNNILQLADQDKLDDVAELEGGVIIRNTAGMPGRIFNARIAPIAPYAIKGFLWYQGESNAGRGEDPRHYRSKMRALVDGWRNAWSQPSLPFYFVQLPAFNDTATGWVRLREEQRLSLSIAKTGMAVTIDLRDPDIHPANKFDVGKRLALWAMAGTYQMDEPCSGPLFRSATVEGHSIRVEFDHVSDGLMAAEKTGVDLPTETSASLSHFELANKTGQWLSANAIIKGKSVVVSSPSVFNPVAVRYACSGGPANANLYNLHGLPASPFCSDLHLLPWQQMQQK